MIVPTKLLKQKAQNTARFPQEDLRLLVFSLLTALQQHYRAFILC